jgi:hypothetical protein
LWKCSQVCQLWRIPYRHLWVYPDPDANADWGWNIRNVDSDQKCLQILFFIQLFEKWIVWHVYFPEVLIHHLYSEWFHDCCWGFCVAVRVYHPSNSWYLLTKNLRIQVSPVLELRGRWGQGWWIIIHGALFPQRIHGATHNGPPSASFSPRSVTMATPGFRGSPLESNRNTVLTGSWYFQVDLTHVGSGYYE